MQIPRSNGGSATVRHFSMETATEMWNLQKICRFSHSIAFGRCSDLRQFDLSHAGYTSVCLTNRFNSYHCAGADLGYLWLSAMLRETPPRFV
jgi:hypothetical protein